MITSDNNPALYVFSAKGLQEFVLGSDELRDMVGATERIDQLPRKTLEDTLESLNLIEGDGYTFLTQAAGSARIYFKKKTDAARLAAVWPMICTHAAPGLEMVQTVVSVDGRYLQAVEQAEQNLVVERNRLHADLPEITPVIARNPRSGLPVVQIVSENGGKVPVDTQSRVKRKCREGRNLFETFGLQENNEEKAPNMFEDIAGDDRDYLAVVHADGNGLGQMFIILAELLKDSEPDQVQKFYTALSKGIEAVTKSAVQAAVYSIRPRFWNSNAGKKIWPILPIVLAGDDLTVVMRADLALDFTATFQKTFKEASRKMLSDLKEKYNELNTGDTLKGYLTAGAGIVFIKRRFPFSTAYELCESLAGYAKNEAKKATDGKPTSSTLAFHRVTASSVSKEFGRLLEGELTGAMWKGKNLTASLAPYAADPEDKGGFAALDDLQRLAGIFHELPRGQSRELLHLIENDASRAQKHYDRLLKNLGKNDMRLKQVMKSLTGHELRPWDDDGRSPVGDAIVLAYFLEKGKGYAEGNGEGGS